MELESNVLRFQALQTDFIACSARNCFIDRMEEQDWVPPALDRNMIRENVSKMVTTFSNQIQIEEENDARVGNSRERQLLDSAEMAEAARLQAIISTLQQQCEDMDKIYAERAQQKTAVEKDIANFESVGQLNSLRALKEAEDVMTAAKAVLLTKIGCELDRLKLFG